LVLEVLHSTATISQVQSLSDELLNVEGADDLQLLERLLLLLLLFIFILLLPLVVLLLKRFEVDDVLDDNDEVLVVIALVLVTIATSLESTSLEYAILFAQLIT